MKLALIHSQRHLGAGGGGGMPPTLSRAEHRTTEAAGVCPVRLKESACPGILEPQGQQRAHALVGDCPLFCPFKAGVCLP